MQGLIDMHCHIVPGVDDGARDLYDAAKILQLEYRNQVQAVIVTPHYRAGMFETPQREIERQFQRIDEMTRRSRSGMRVYLGCEYHTNAHMVEDLKKGLRPTMAGTEYVLVEFSGRHNYQIIRNQVYALLTHILCTWEKIRLPVHLIMSIGSNVMYLFFLYHLVAKLLLPPSAFSQNIR